MAKGVISPGPLPFWGPHSVFKITIINIIIIWLFLHIRSHKIVLYLYSLIWYKNYVRSTDTNRAIPGCSTCVIIQSYIFLTKVCLAFAWAKISIK